jgi:hypothetical protein
MKSHRKVRTKIGDISPHGFELTESQLALVSGGLPPAGHWEPSGSIVNPGESDTAQDWVPD